MEKVDTASTASDDVMKSLFGEFEKAKDTLQKDFNRAKETLKKDFNRDNDALGKDFDRAKDEFDKAKDVLGKAKNQIHEGFEELREDQDALAAENGVLDVDGSEILDINAGGVIISVSRDTLTQIKGTRLEALFSGRWEKRLPKDGDGRVLLDVNPNCFRAVVDYLNEQKITPPNSPIEMPHLEEEDDIIFQQLLLAFGLVDDGAVQSKRSAGELELVTVSDGSDENPKALKDQWQSMNFDSFPKEPPHEIQTVLKEEQKALLAANNDLIEQQLLFEEENNDLRFFLGDDEDIVLLNFSGTLMATKRSTLGLCKNSVLAKQFDEPLWVQQDNTKAVKKWSCEDVSKWVTAIEGMPDNIGATFVGNDVNGVALLVMGREDLKDIGVTKAGPLALLLKEITNLCREKKSEAVFIDHSAYCFQKILDTLRLRSMCHSEEKPPSVYIQGSQQERFKKIVEYYFPGEYSDFILQRGEIDSTILSKHNSSQIESWLLEDGVLGDLELLYRGSRDG